MERKRNTPLAAIFVMLIILVAIVYAFFIRPNYYLINGGEVELKVIYKESLGYTGEHRVEVMDDMVYIATTEGLVKRSIDGEDVWNKSYHFNELLFLNEAPYLATVNITGKDAYIYDENGSVASIYTDYGIVTGSLNESGYLTLITENKNEHYITVYDKEGNLKVKRRTIFDNDGYPICASMSPDGTKMATMHLDISQHMIESVITFLNFSSEGEAYTDRIVGHERIQDTMVSRIHFIDENHLVCVGDDQLLFYEMKTVPKLLKTYDVTAYIEAYQLTAEGIVVDYGDEMAVSGDEQSNHLIYYSANGEIILNDVSERKVTNLSSDDGTYFVIQSSFITRYKNDQVIWETELNGEVKRIVALSGNRFLVVYSGDYEVLKMENL